MIDYKTSAKPRIVTKDDVAVFCSYDEILPIGQLQPNPQNPNQHNEQQVKLLGEIIRSAGWRAPITISKRSGLIVKGHGRFAGSGTTMVACEKMGRKAVLMELDPKYCDVIIRRYIQESGNLDLKVERDGEIKSLKDVMEEAGATLE